MIRMSTRAKLSGLFAVAGAAALLVGLSACGSSPSPVLPPTPLTTIEHPRSVTRLWDMRVGNGVGDNYLKVGPAVAGDRGYVADDKGQVRAFDANNGKKIWEVHLHLPVTGGVGLADNRVLVGTRRGEVVALSQNDGSVLWHTTVSSEVLAAPRGAQGVVVVRTIDGRVFGLDADTGKRDWTYDGSVPVLTLRGTSAPVIANGMVICGFDNGKLVALTLNNGTVLWETTVAVPRGRTELERIVDIDGDPVVRGNTVYVASYQGRVAAVQLDTGRMLWARDISSYAGLAVDDKKVYVTDAIGQVWALDRYAGATLWKQDKLKRRQLTAPVLDGKDVVVGDYAGYLHWLSTEDGHLVARTRVKGPGAVFRSLEPDPGSFKYPEPRALLATPLVADNSIVAMDQRGVLSAFRLTPQ